MVGYYGPVADELSTEAEVAFYEALAKGALTRHGVRQARARLARASAESRKGMRRAESITATAGELSPFAWAQLVLYHRGPDHPLTTELPKKHNETKAAPHKRKFIGPLERQISAKVFIGRRRELHESRKKLQAGQKVFVYQGLGGLGKTTLALRAVSTMTNGQCALMNVWCRELERNEDQAGELVNRLSDLGQEILGLQWGGVVQSVDQISDLTTAERFEQFLRIILERVPRLVIHLDNLETLLSGAPEKDDAQAFADWREPQTQAIWQTLQAQSGEKLSVVASCRYRNADFAEVRIHVQPMKPDTIFRMMSWHEGLRRLSVTSRAQLAERLHGHPRAVQFLDALIGEQLRDWDDTRGPWTTPGDEAEIEREWNDLIQPALGTVVEQIHEDLLLEKIWSHVLDDRCRRMLLRMTLLLRPWDWDLMLQLGEPDAEDALTVQTAEKLRTTSLLGEVRGRNEEGSQIKLYEVHPMTSEFIIEQFSEEEREQLRLETFRRVGTFLEKRAENWNDPRVDLEAGHYLFEYREFDRAFELLGRTSQLLQKYGMVRQGLAILKRFGKSEIENGMAPKKRMQMLGMVGAAYLRLGQVDKAIKYREQALAISRRIKNRKGESIQLMNLGSAHAALGQVEKAIEYYKRGLAISREIGDRSGEGDTLGNLGMAYADLDQNEKAIEYCKLALAISQETGIRRTEGQHLGNLGLAYANLGQLEKAIEYYQQGLVISRETGNRRGEGISLGNLGMAYANMGQTAKAIEYHEKALEISQEIGDRNGEGQSFANLGMAYASLGQVEKARSLATQALAIGEEIKAPQIVRDATEIMKILDSDSPASPGH